MHVQPTEWWGEWGRCVVKCGVTESVEIGVCVHLSVTVRTMRALRLCVSVCVLVCVRPSVCVFHGCSLRLINIDSELSLLAGSQVGSIEQI